MDTAKDLGLALAHRRKELGITQEELAELAGVSARSVSVIENGKETAQLSSVLSLANSVGLRLTLLPRTTDASR